MAWATDRGHTLALSIYLSAEQFLFHYEDDRRLDLLLLDIQMPGLDGVALAKRIRLHDARVQLIFITGFADFVLEGYEVGALHYLMKPVDAEKLVPVLDRAVARLAQTGRSITIEADGAVQRIATRDILYAEAFSHEVALHTVDGAKWTLKQRLSDVEALLGEGFFRSHRSYVVGLAHVQRVTRKAMLLPGGVEIPLARAQYDAANRAFIKACREE